MIQVLVMANDSLLADHIVSTMSREIDLDVFRMTRDELGSRRDYSVVIVVDEEMDEREPIQLNEIMRNDSNLLLIRVSLKDSNVYVDERYQIANPGIGQMVNVVRNFNSRNSNAKSDTTFQKKMNETHITQTELYNLQPAYFQAEDFVTTSDVHVALQSREYAALPITT